MLGEVRAFWPAGQQLTTDHTVTVSIRPAASIDAKPLFGASASPDLDENEKIEDKVEIQVARDGDVGPSIVGQIELEIPVPSEPEEVRQPRVARRPVLPTKAEVEEHFPLHLQYRDWCMHCRYGKANLAPHLAEPSDREKLGITVSADFAFMGAEEAEESMQPALVLYDDSKRAF